MDVHTIVRTDLNVESLVSIEPYLWLLVLSHVELVRCCLGGMGGGFRADTLTKVGVSERPELDYIDILQLVELTTTPFIKIFFLF